MTGHNGSCWRALDGTERFLRLKAAVGALDGMALIRTVASGAFPGRTAVASSFGAESAILLALVARVDRSIPVLFLETGKLFPETLAYAKSLCGHLGLADVRYLRPDPALLATRDPDGKLWRSDPNRCCHDRKVSLFRAALEPFDCWIAGLKRVHGGARAEVEPIELEQGRIKLNPLALWTEADVERAFVEWELPRHPLASLGYRSIGCMPCTRMTRPGEGARAGRWDGWGKTECGLHGGSHPSACSSSGSRAAGESVQAACAKPSPVIGDAPMT